MLPACKCRLGCSRKVLRERRAELFAQYFKLDEDGQKAMLISFGRFPKQSESDNESESGIVEENIPSSPPPAAVKPGKREVTNTPVKHGKREVTEEFVSKKVDKRKIPKQHAKKKRVRPRKSPKSAKLCKANTTWAVDGKKVCKT